MDTEPPAQPEAGVGGNWTCPSCNNVNFESRTVCNMRSCGLSKPKDTVDNSGAQELNGEDPQDNSQNWMCPWCSNDNFPNRKVCNRRTCGMPKPRDDLPLPTEEGNWICPACANENFPQRTQCNKRTCGLPKPEPEPTENWICKSCGNENFPNRFTCNRRSCGLPRSGGGRAMKNNNNRPAPPESALPGSNWDCPTCGNENYPHRQVCNRRGCGAPKPGEKDGNNWMCPYCNNENYPSRMTCNSRSCKRPKPGLVQGPGPVGILTASSPLTRGGNPLTSKTNALQNDGGNADNNWVCPSCGNNNYASREICNRRTCGIPRPTIVQQNFSRSTPQGGQNWTCPKCNNSNYPNRDVCNMRHCNVRRPQIQFTNPRISTANISDAQQQSMWSCEACGNMNFESRSVCNMRSCGAPRPMTQSGFATSLPQNNIPPLSTPPSNAPEGNWQCAACGNTNYAHRSVCNIRSCAQPRPQGGGHSGGIFGTMGGARGGGGGGRQGSNIGGDNNGGLHLRDDGRWNCPKCGNLNYSDRQSCNMRNCKAPRPAEGGGRNQKRQRENNRPGENWDCMECGNSNFPDRTVCNMRKCLAPRPDSDEKRLKSDVPVESLDDPIVAYQE